MLLQNEFFHIYRFSIAICSGLKFNQKKLFVEDSFEMRRAWNSRKSKVSGLWTKIWFLG